MKRGLILLLLLPAVFAEVHYVTQNGGGDGSSAASPWSVDDFNNPDNWDSVIDSDNGKIGPGDIVYFAGTIFDEVSPKGSGTAGHYIVLDGYEDGECAPKPKEPCPGVTIDRNSGGQNYHYGMYIENQDYLEIRDFNIIDGSHGIVIYGEDKEGTDGETSDYILVRDNHISDISATAMSLRGHWRREWPFVEVSTTYVTIGGKRGDGNVFYNIAEGNCESAGSAITLSYSKDTIISYNTFYNDYSPLCGNGCDAVVTIPDVERILVEYNTMYGMGEDALDFKGDVKDGIVRFNKASRLLQAAWQIHNGADNIYVYGNLADGNMLVSDSDKTNWYGLMGYRGPKNVFYWSNIAYDWYGPGFSVNADYKKDIVVKSENINLWGNTLAFNNRGMNNARGGGMEFGDPLSAFARNNIAYRNSIGTPSRPQIKISSGVNPNADIDYNMYYYSDTDTISGMLSTDYAYMTDSLQPYTELTGQESHGTIEDPLFVNPAKRDYTLGEGAPDFTLQADSPAIDSGVPVRVSDLYNWNPPTIQGKDYGSEVAPDLALDPLRTDWSQTPPVVYVISQDDYGEGWEKGAYIYIDGDVPCDSEWDCDDWSCGDCSGNEKTCSRTCTDTNECESDKTESKTEPCSQHNMIYAYKTGKEITIDGDISEFFGSPVELVSSRGSFGRYWFLWDDDFLYIAGSVTDNQLNAQYTAKDSNLWSDDSLEMVFDVDNSGGNELASDDYKIFLSARDVIADTKKWDTTWDSGIEHKVIYDGSLNSNSDIDIGYTIEAKVPLWYSTENAWGFNLIMNDKYAGGSENILWSGAVTNRPDDAGELLFETCPQINDIISHIQRWKSGADDLAELIEHIQVWLVCG